MPKDKKQAFESLTDLYLELANVKAVEFSERVSNPDTAIESERWKMASEGDLTVLLDSQRSEGLLGEGTMRDLARRVQALRKELGFKPTDLLNAVHLAELDDESAKLLEPYLKEMAELVRTKGVSLHKKKEEVNVKWHEYKMDNQKVYVAIQND